MDTTPTEGSSERHPSILTESVPLVAPPDMEPKLQITASQSVQAGVQAANQAKLLDVGSSLISELTFSMLIPYSLASFIYCNFIIPKLTKNTSFSLCREQFFHQYYHPHLVLFFQLNIGGTCLTFSLLDALIVSALHLEFY